MRWRVSMAFSVGAAIASFREMAAGSMKMSIVCQFICILWMRELLKDAKKQ